MNASSPSLVAGSTDKKATTLTAAVLPENATNKNVIWTLSEGYGDLVEVSGKLTDTQITLTLKDGVSITEEKKITVTATSVTDATKKGTMEITITAANQKPSGDTEIDPSLTDGIYLIKKGDEANKTKHGTIASALAAIPNDATESDTYTIQLARGTYNENALRYTRKANLVILGNTESKFGADVIIAGKGSSQSSMVVLLQRKTCRQQRKFLWSSGHSVYARNLLVLPVLC